LALAGIPPLTGVSLSSRTFGGVAFGNVESMTTCDVLRCQGPRDNVFVLLEEPLLEAAVCTEHYTRLTAGEQWMLDHASGVLMDTDIPPTVTEYTLSGLLSGEKGVSLNLELTTPGGPRSQTLWLSSEDADGLGELLTNRIVR
jgi:hypothetical protein